ncbi:MAG: shikimate dehydrogenase [bacterium]
MDSLMTLNDLPQGFKILGIVGWPLEHSLSAFIHNAALKALSLPYLYLSLPVSENSLPDLISRLKSLGARGLNVTVPYKEKIVPLLDEIPEEVRKIGAVNTLVFEGGIVRGENTDAGGFLAAWNEEVGEEIAGKRALLLGSGGAARAVAFAMASRGLGGIYLFSRNEEKRKALARDLLSGFPSLLTEESSRRDEEILAEDLRKADFLINATPLGMYPGTDEMPLTFPEEVNPSLLVFDLIYNPLETRLLREARERGLHASNGLGMLIHQGARSFEIWTGRKPPLSLMREAALKALKT